MPVSGFDQGVLRQSEGVLGRTCQTGILQTEETEGQTFQDPEDFPELVRIARGDEQGFQGFTSVRTGRTSF